MHLNVKNITAELRVWVIVMIWTEMNYFYNDVQLFEMHILMQWKPQTLLARKPNHLSMLDTSGAEWQNMFSCNLGERTIQSQSCKMMWPHFEHLLFGFKKTLTQETLFRCDCGGLAFAASQFPSHFLTTATRTEQCDNVLRPCDSSCYKCGFKLMFSL